MSRIVGDERGDGERDGVPGRLLRRPLWLAAMAASAGAGIIHLAHGPAHLEELGAVGAGFYLAAALQLGWAALAFAVLAASGAALSSRRIAVLAASGIAINGAILAAWLTSRAVGLPAGAAPWSPEQVGLADGITAILQGMLVVGLIMSLRGWAVPGLPRAQRLATAGAAVAMLLIATGTAVAISPSEVDSAHPRGYEHGAMKDQAAPGDQVETDGHAEDGGHAEPSGS